MNETNLLKKKSKEILERHEKTLKESEILKEIAEKANDKAQEITQNAWNLWDEHLRIKRSIELITFYLKPKPRKDKT